MCWVVGARFSGQTPSALFERWNGTNFSALPVQSSGAGIALNSVACISANACYAVGNQQTSASHAQVVVERWNGTTWQRVSAPSPSGSSWALLTSLSCAPSGACVAIGDAQNGSSGPGYFFGEKTTNGTAWTLATAAAPRKFDLGNETGLYDMGCLSPSRCLAVGGALDYTPPGGQMGANFPGGVVERWDGSSWGPLALPATSPLKSLANLPDGVACLPSGTCWIAFAYGPPQSPAAAALTLGEWSGGTLTFAPPISTTKGSLDAISCSPSGWCMTFGEGAGATAASPAVFIAEQT